MSSPCTCTDSRRLRAVTQFALGGLLLLCLWPAHAARFETLLMPGKLIEGHAKYEQQCERCHEKFSKTSQSTLCLKCHEKVAADVTDGSGYHGRSTQVKEQVCKSCHTDHIGRDARIVLLDRETFDHDATDFKLEGAHRGQACSGCHKEGSPLRDAPHTCIACHKATDPHKGRMGEKCADCHTQKTWKKNSFDHDKTDFRLQGRHSEVLCAACHPNQRYKDTPQKCVGCHRIDDVHGGGYGDKCQSCHRSDQWKKVRFDHARDTKFRLPSDHTRLQCNACHTPALGKKKPAKTCNGCHRDDDMHKGRNGSRCQDCHSTRGWKKVKFDHAKDTAFTLNGRHSEVPCRGCHQGKVQKREQPRRCEDCHRQDDVHQGELGEQCRSCHNERGWRRDVAFDHDLSHFPLIGMHAIAPCEGCHLDQKFKDTKGGACSDCHKDPHKQTLGNACRECHNPNGWMLWRFDHDSTDFKLDGAHDGLACKGCHTEPRDPQHKLPGDCFSCHEQDDIHRGGFGKRCARCHDTEAFSHINVQR